jgi:hypothetical protein
MVININLKGIVMPKQVIITWPEPFNRANAHVLKSDIPAAMQFFKDSLGGEVSRLYFNPMYLHGKTSLDHVFPEDIEVIEHAGVASWEIWGETTGNSAPSGKAVVESLPDTSLKPLNDKNGGAILQPLEEPVKRIIKQNAVDCSAPVLSKIQNSQRHRGRPRLSGPYLSKATRWRRQQDAKKHMEAMPI